MLSRIILFFLVSTFVSAQNTDSKKVLAKIGDKEITVKEFKLRYELTPQISRSSQTDTVQKKEDFLHSLIAEKLWALEAESQELDTSDLMRLTFPALEKMHIRDALYKKEINEKASSSPDEFTKLLNRANYNLLARIVAFETKDAAELAYNKLTSNSNFDSLFQHASTDLKTALEIKFDDLNETAEDKVYALGQNEFSEPVLWNNSWNIFYIDEIKQNVFDTEAKIRTRDTKIRSVVEKRAINKRYNSYYNNFFRGKEIDSDGYIFWSFADKLIQILNEHALDYQSKGESPANLKMLPGDLSRIKSMFGKDSLSLPFIKLDNKTISINEFLHDFALEGFYTSTLNPDIIRGQLRSRVKYFIERELLSIEAINQGMHNAEEVEEFTSIWRDNYMGNSFRNKLKNEVQVNDKDLLDFYNSKKSGASLPTMVNIVEVLIGQS
jgi:hypothetical protein